MGTISPKIQQLNTLSKLSFYNCTLWGTLPTEIGMLTHMQIMYLSANAAHGKGLHGTLPKELMRLTSLEHFTIKSHRFSGTVPSEVIGEMRNMTILGLQENDLTGTLPTQLGLLTK